MIYFKDLWTTQTSVRNHRQVIGMAEFVSEGGRFNRKSLERYAENNNTRPAPLTQINRFEDGSLFILDGHHRGIGIFEGGRDHFYDDEYEIIEYTFKDFQDIVFLWPNGDWMGWVTPFDPRERVRYPDIKVFKDKVKDIYDSQGSEAALLFIDSNQDMYSTLRKDLIMPVDTVPQLREVWKTEIKKIRAA